MQNSRVTDIINGNRLEITVKTRLSNDSVLNQGGFRPKNSRFLRLIRNVYFFFHHLRWEIRYTVPFMVSNSKKILYESYFLDLERIKIMYDNSNGKNCFRFGTNHFSNCLLERIMFDNLFD